MTDTARADAELRYDPYDYEIDRNAQAVWKRLRDEAPLYRNDEYDFYAVSRYDDVLRAVLDTTTFSSAHGTVIEMMTPEAGGLPMMIFMDPPEHSWHRKLVSRSFTMRTMAALEDRVTRVCQDLLDPFVGSGGFDYVDQFGAILPPTMILALLGFPEGFEQEWRKGVDSLFHMEPGEAGFRSEGGQAIIDQAERGELLGAGGTLGSGVFEALPELLEQRRRDPQDDLMTTLVHTELEQADGTTRPLTHDEIVMFVQLIAIAGTETVARLLGWSAVLLDAHPDQRARLAADTDLLPNAVEEILRYEAPSPVNGRWVTADAEFHGQTVPAGSKLILLNGAANRDERHYPDADRFDVTRSIDRHLSFGYGAHFCIGAALARLEGRVALRETLRRFPEWSVDHERAEMVHTSTVRGYEKLPISF